MAVHSHSARRSGRSRAQMENEFYKHAVLFGLVHTGLAVHNLVTAPGEIWFVYPMFGWGIGLAAHGVQAMFAPRPER